MITITVKQDELGHFASLSAEGHAGVGAKGSDPVCASVSALMSAFAFGLKEVLRTDAAMKDDGDTMTIVVPAMGATMMNRLNDLASTFVGSLEIISKKYPDAVRIVRD